MEDVMMVVGMLEELGFPVHRPVLLHCDNNSAVCTYDTEIAEWRTPTLATKFYHSRDYIDQGNIKIVYIPTDDNNADIHTKPLDSVAHYRHAKWMGMRFEEDEAGECDA